MQNNTNGTRRNEIKNCKPGFECCRMTFGNVSTHVERSGDGLNVRYVRETKTAKGSISEVFATANFASI